MSDNTIQFCDDIRLIELAADVHNRDDGQDLWSAIMFIISDHYFEEGTRVLLGTFAVLRFRKSAIDLKTFAGKLWEHTYTYSGIKDIDFFRLVSIAGDFTDIIDYDLHRPVPDEPDAYEIDLSEVC